MSSTIRALRGTHDLLPDDFDQFHVVGTRAPTTSYDFREMATPAV